MRRQTEISLFIPRITVGRAVHKNYLTNKVLWDVITQIVTQGTWLAVPLKYGIEAEICTVKTGVAMQKLQNGSQNCAVQLGGRIKSSFKK